MNYLGLDFDGDGFTAALANLITPSLWRIDDGYKAAQILGCNVVLGETLGMNSGLAGRLYPTLGGDFDEDVFQVIDYAVYKARDYGIRLIIPFEDYNRYYFWGDFTDFEGWGGGDFFNSATAMTNFKVYIAGLINRVNTYNDIRYGDDPYIMGWATINEMWGDPEPYWTSQVAAYIKSLAPNQLVIDGRSPVWQVGVDTESLIDPNVDVITDHFYPMSVTNLETALATPNLSNKVYFCGEYDWNHLYGGSTLDEFLTAIENSPAVRGNLFYTLASHGDLKGWAASRNDYRGVPSVTLGNDAGYGDPTIQAQMDRLRQHHYAMRGISAPAYPVPDAPTITDSTGTFQWRGVAGACSYTLQKSTTSAEAGFSDLATGLDDTDSPYTDAAGTAWYRIKALNRDGVAGDYSEVVQVTFA